jgi:hypothetical protein
MSKKIITFCVFGELPVFTEGAIENAKLAQTIYPDWISRFYLFKECHSLEDRLKEYNNIETVLVPQEGNYFSTLYRFLPLGEDVSYFISRDTDSRLSYREKHAVDQWISSGKTFHIMKDHPYHHTVHHPILAGMFGGRGNVTNDIKTVMLNFCAALQNSKGVDQDFLNYYFLQYIKNDYLEHNENNFPTQRNFEIDKIHFVGQPFDENNNFYGDWKNDLSLLNIG